MIQSKDNLDDKILLFDEGHIKVKRNNRWADDVLNKSNFSSLSFRSLCAGLLEAKVKSEDIIKINSYTTPEIKKRIYNFNERFYNHYEGLVSNSEGTTFRGKTKLKKLIYEELLNYINIINDNLKVFKLVDKNEKEYEFLKEKLVKIFEKEIRLITKKRPSREDRSLLSMALFLSSLTKYDEITIYSPDSDIYLINNLISNCLNLKKYNPSKIEVINTNKQPIPFEQFFETEFGLPMEKIRRYLIEENYYRINN